MKILHIWNTAGVASIIAKFMDRIYGTESRVVTRKAFDPYGLTVYGEAWNCGKTVFVLKSLEKALRTNIVHVHGVDKIIPYVKVLGKPLVLHYHGDDIRGLWKEKEKYWKNANAVLYSTDELRNIDTPKEAIYFPNPVDIDFFHRRSDIERMTQTAMTISYGADDLAEEFAKKYNLNLTTYAKNIPYLDMAKTMCRYEYYVDVKRDSKGTVLKGERSLSKIAYEALACGCKVITPKGEVKERLPLEHLPENAVKRLKGIYRGI